MSSELFGWNPDLEEQHAEAMSACTLELPCAASGTPIPKDMDYDWFLQDLQFMWPFCHAHMRTGMEEILAFLRLHKVFQYSRRLASVLDMRMDGNDRAPAGASIGGSIRAGMKWGTCLESLYPYFPNIDPSQFSRTYSNQIPADVMASAGHIHIASVSPAIRSFADLDSWNTSGKAAIGLGIDWTTGWDALQGIEVLDHVPGGTVRGGHALLIAGWKTVGGQRYPYLHNSQTDRWGKRRRIAIAPKVWDAILPRTRFGAYAATSIDMDDPAPTAQPWDWVANADFAGTGGIKISGGAV